MKRFYIVFQGQVQGVGFRFFSQMTAIKCNITGWVHNMSNGMVDMEIQGEEQNIDKFLVSIKKGNRFCRIDDYSLKNMPIIEYEKGFKIH